MCYWTVSPNTANLSVTVIWISSRVNEERDKHDKGEYISSVQDMNFRMRWIVPSYLFPVTIEEVRVTVLN